MLIMVENIPPPRESIQHSSETVIYLGVSFYNWGHCITDNIRRVWFFNSDIFKQEFKNCPIVYISHGGKAIDNLPNFRRLLEILNVDVDKLHLISQPTRFEKIILPDESFFLDEIIKFTNEYREAIERIRYFSLKNRTSTSSERIYYFHGRRQIGEERLAEYFKSKGYSIVRPEKLPLDEQLNLLINCKSFASTLGSTSHNSIFLSDDTESIFIPRGFNILNPYQSSLNQVHPVNANYIDSTLSIFYDNKHFMYILSPQLKRFFGDKWNGYEDDDFLNFLQYVKDSIVAALPPKQLNAYSEILQNFMDQLLKREDLIAAYNMPTYWDTFQPSSGYQTHVHKKGWGVWQKKNSTSGSTKDKLDIQAVKINFPGHKVYYSVYYNDKEGWSEEVLSPEMVGTTGKAKSIYGIRIRLDEIGAKGFDILYRVHTFDDTWTPWAKNGEAIYSFGVKLNALQIKLEPKT
ncbi:MAG: DUF563 domain-containing protein [Selenomonadaceae bacterium]|nr:DUF563 domain-containing protein [Selenomonadaceae bacterium]